MIEIWTEKYRPKTLSEIKGQDRAIHRIKELIQEKNIPHLILEGQPGTGKTTTALCIVNELYRNVPSKVKIRSYKELNASDTRGIDTIRTTIKSFNRSVKNPLIPFKILILDEADHMTMSAQQSLRRQMELYTDNCRMILICNYKNKIISPIQSRCAVIHFEPISIDIIYQQLKEISTKENFNIDDKNLRLIADLSNGDLRNAINILHASYIISISGNGKITEDDIYDIYGLIPDDKIKKLLKNIINGDLMNSLDLIDEFIGDGYSANEIINAIFDLIEKNTKSDVALMLISSVTARTIHRINIGCSEIIQLRGFISEIYKNRGVFVDLVGKI